MERILLIGGGGYVGTAMSNYFTGRKNSQVIVVIISYMATK